VTQFRARNWCIGLPLCTVLALLTYGNMPNGLKGKHVFVTGGARGIGRAIADAFGRESAILSLADCHAQNLDFAVRELRAAGSAAHAQVLDVTDCDAVSAAVDEAERRRAGAQRAGA